MVHLEKFGFEWKIPASNLNILLNFQLIKKTNKKNEHGKNNKTNRGYGALLQIPQTKKTLRSFILGYFRMDDIIENYFALDSTNSSKDFTATTTDQKNYYMRHYEVSSDLVGGNRIIYARAARR